MMILVVGDKHPLSDSLKSHIEKNIIFIVDRVYDVTSINSDIIYGYVIILKAWLGHTMFFV